MSKIYSDEAAEITKDEPNPNIYFNAGLLYDTMGEPLTALSMFHKALEYDGGHILAQLNIGNFYFKRNYFEKALQFYLTTLKALDEDSSKVDSDKPNLLFVLNNLGQCFRETGKLNAALATFERAIALSSNAWMLGNVFAVKGLLCNWANNEVIEYNFELAVQNKSKSIPSDELYVDPYSVSLLTFAEPRTDIIASILACPQSPVFLDAPATANQVLQVGYVSYDWRDHPMGRLTSYLVTNHNESKVNVTCFSYGPDDRSEVSQYVRNSSKHFVDYFRLSNDFEVASAIHSMSIDILVDITAHTYNGRIDIVALKPAPITINYLGFPGTTGCAGFDYTMVDRFVVPPEMHRKAFTENLIYLPYIYQANNMPIEVPTCESRMSCRSERRTLRNPDKRFYSPSVRWICSFNANKKLEKVSFFTWMNVLRRFPLAILLLQDTNIEAKENILNQAEFFGILRSRIHFVPSMKWKDHLFRAAACDLVLDTFVYGAHTTSSDMLWMWVPVLSLAGWGSGRMPSRVAAAITQSLSLQLNEGSEEVEKDSSPQPMDVLVEYSVKGYEDSAIRLLKNIKLLFKLHELVGSKTLVSATFDSVLMERSIEQAFQLVSEYRHLFNYRTTSDDLLSNYTRSRASVVVTKTKTVSQNWRRNQCRNLSVEPLEEITSLDKNFSVSLRRRCNFQPNDLTLEVVNKNDVSCDEIDILNKLRNIVQLRLSTNDSYCLQSPESVSKLHQASLLDIAIHLESVVAWQVEASCANESSIFSLFSSFFLESFRPADVVLFLSKHIDYSMIWEDFDFETISLYISAILCGLFSSCSFFRAASYAESSITSFRNIDVIRAFILEQTSQFLNVHAVCLHSMGFFDDSISVFASSFLISNNTRGLMNAGIALMDTGELDIGFLLASQSHVIEHKHLLNGSGSESKRKQEEVLAGRLRIAIYCYEYGQAWWPGWGPSSVKREGMGGSEEAVYYSSIELAKLGHHVYIFGELSLADIGHTTIYPVDCNPSTVTDNCGAGFVRWLHYSSFDIDEVFDIFIAWRYVISLSLTKSSRASFLWLHDLVSAATFPKSYFNLFDGILVQSSFHKAYVEGLFASMSTVKNSLSFEGSKSSMSEVFIVPNGILVSDLTDGPNHQNVFIYGSAPNRGLQHILDSWKFIRANIPNATLRVYYGFTDAFQKSMVKTMGEEQYSRWHGQMISLLQQDGIEYFGSVRHAELAEAYGQAGFFLYPTDFQETGCISVLRAMASGCIPITSRLRESVLFNLTSTFDFGPDEPLNLSTARDGQAMRRWVRDLWAVSVVTAFHTDESVLRSKRTMMKRTIREQYSWASTASTIVKAVSML